MFLCSLFSLHCVAKPFLLAPLLHSSKLTQAPRRLRFAPCASKKSKHNFYTTYFVQALTSKSTPLKHKLHTRYYKIKITSALQYTKLFQKFKFLHKKSPHFSAEASITTSNSLTTIRKYLRYPDHRPHRPRSYHISGFDDAFH